MNIRLFGFPPQTLEKLQNLGLTFDSASNKILQKNVPVPLLSPSSTPPTLLYRAELNANPNMDDATLLNLFLRLLKLSEIDVYAIWKDHGDRLYGFISKSDNQQYYLTRVMNAYQANPLLKDFAQDYLNRITEKLLIEKLLLEIDSKPKSKRGKKKCYDLLTDRFTELVIKSSVTEFTNAFKDVAALKEIWERAHDELVLAIAELPSKAQVKLLTDLMILYDKNPTLLEKVATEYVNTISNNDMIICCKNNLSFNKNLYSTRTFVFNLLNEKIKKNQGNSTTTDNYLNPVFNHLAAPSPLTPLVIDEQLFDFFHLDFNQPPITSLLETTNTLSDEVEKEAVTKKRKYSN